MVLDDPIGDFIKLSAKGGKIGNAPMSVKISQD